MFYTGIGSRKASPEATKMGREIGKRLAAIGYTLRSGAAAGMDVAFEEGVVDHGGRDCVLREIYLPWQFFRIAHWVPGPSDVKIVPSHDVFQLAFSLLEESGVCRDIRHMRNDVKHLFGRNVCQVMGMSIAPICSDFVVYWAPIDDSGECTGGTRIAVNLAKYLGVPTYNLQQDNEQSAFFKLLSKLEGE